MSKIDEELLTAIGSDAAMKTNTEKQEQKTRTIQLHNVPVDWISSVIGKSGLSFSSYAKQAVKRQMEADGLL
jgi:hypothetical protein